MSTSPESIDVPEPVRALVRLAIEEDIAGGDVTGEYFVPSGATGAARIVSRETGVAAGASLAGYVMQQVDPAIEVGDAAEDGSRLERGTVMLRAEGPIRSLLTAERTALNFCARLSGIATLTGMFVAAAARSGAAARVLDTRKTTPGWRWLEKAAVRAGGGTNHRMGLFDMVMVKDNHLLAESSDDALRRAVAKLRSERPEVPVELEADTVDQARRFMTIDGVDRILLDNMSLDEIRMCVQLRRERTIKLEASGGVTLESIADIAATGVDFISAGALTHSARSLDLSMELT